MNSVFSFEREGTNEEVNFFLWKSKKEQTLFFRFLLRTHFVDNGSEGFFLRHRIQRQNVFMLWFYQTLDHLVLLMFELRRFRVKQFVTQQSRFGDRFDSWAMCVVFAKKWMYLTWNGMIFRDRCSIRPIVLWFEIAGYVTLTWNVPPKGDVCLATHRVGLRMGVDVDFVWGNSQVVSAVWQWRHTCGYFPFPPLFCLLAYPRTF